MWNWKSERILFYIYFSPILLYFMYELLTKYKLLTFGFCTMLRIYVHSSSKETQLFLFHFPWWPWVFVGNWGSWTLSEMVLMGSYACCYQEYYQKQKFTTWPLIYNLLQNKWNFQKLRFFWGRVYVNISFLI